MKIFVMPYMHTREIVLAEKKPDEIIFSACMEKPYIDNNTARFMVLMNITKSILYLYTEAGFLIHTKSMKEEVKDFGKPVQVSPDGKIYLFFKEATSKLTQFKLSLDVK
jgi:hypothetical protein